jgi:hypothetical protein
MAGETLGALLLGVGFGGLLIAALVAWEEWQHRHREFVPTPRQAPVEKSWAQRATARPRVVKEFYDWALDDPMGDDDDDDDDDDDAWEEWGRNA